jgi:hypothetical protein
MTNATFEAQRIARISRLLAAFCLFLIIVLPVTLAAYWALADAAQLALRGNLSPSAMQAPVQTWQRVVGGLLAEVPLALLLLGVWQARRCFALFAAGQVFTAEAVRCLRRFAGWVMASVLAGFITGPATSVLLTLQNPPGMRHLAVGIGSDQLFTLFFAGMVWLMAAVIGQGQVLAEENATFV